MGSKRGSHKVDPSTFRKVMGSFATGVTVVTTRGAEGPYGVTVNSFTSVSLKPPLVLVCLDNRLSGLNIFQLSGNFGVSILSDGQQDISRRFSTRGADRSSELYETGQMGIPLLRDSLARLECRVMAEYPAGDHTILVGKVMTAEVRQRKGERPLVFFRGRYRRMA